MTDRRPARALAALMLGAAIALSACSKKDAGSADTGIGLGTDTAAGMTDTMVAAPPAPLTDGNIVYVLDQANRLDSAAGAIAATKGTNSEVREYGTRMTRDHHNLRKQGQDLATKLGVAPAAPPGDRSQADYDKTMATLNGAGKGRDFDKAYIDNEVEYHKALLETATAAMAAAQNAELKNLIQKAAPVIQGHLDLAQSIQGKLQ